jgi:hypothetical protein
VARKRPDPSRAPERVKLNLSLDVDVVKRLGAYASFRRERMNAVVERALKVEMKGFFFGVRSDQLVNPADPPKLADVG